MKPLSDRRAKVRAIRDKAIQRARDDCKRTLARIATMEFNRRTMVSACVESVVPSGCEFTVVDILAALESLDPVRVWRKHTVNNHLSRMRDRGQIRRTRRRYGSEPAIYARVEVDIPKRPLGNVSLVQAIAAVRGNRTMNATELAIAILETGYETSMGRKALRDAVAAVVCKRDRFDVEK